MTTCIICGSPFVPKNARKPAKTCSRVCTNKMVWATTPNRKTGPQPQPRDIADCLMCGKPVKWAHRPSRQGIYCSRVCAGHAKSKGGIYITSEGRAVVRLRSGSKQLYARCLMEAHLKQDLGSEIHVHHVNGNKSDDRLENLVAIPYSEHHRIHVAQGDYGRQPYKVSSVEITEMIESSRPVREIAASVGVSEALVYYYRRKHRSILKAQSRGA